VKANNWTIAILAAAFCFIVGALALLAWADKDPTAIIAFILAAIPGLFTGILTLSKVGKVGEQVSRVDQNVNGHLHALARKAGVVYGEDTANGGGDSGSEQA
jgi:hypothetical protein